VLFVLTIKYITSVVAFANEKAAREFRDFSNVFWQKIDHWALFACFSHTMNAIAGAMYLANGLDRTEAVSSTFVIMAVGSGSHCILLTRYLAQKSFSKLIVRVAANMFVLMVQFLVGCVVLYVAYLILGLCFFGDFDRNFGDYLTGATVLLAVVHGDTIADRFEQSNNIPTISRIAGFLYWSVWIFFSMGIMYNISISMFEEVLAREVANDQKESEAKQLRDQRIALELLETE
jgi:hypothetical protein